LLWTRAAGAVVKVPTRRHILAITTKEIALADDSKKQQADAQFRKIQRAEDGKKAMAEYEAGAAAIRIKTEKLRQLRLARDAAALAAAPAVTPAKKRAAKAKSPAGSLDTWLAGQAASGRNT
jgi:hypothetical protein